MSTLRVSNRPLPWQNQQFCPRLQRIHLSYPRPIPGPCLVTPEWPPQRRLLSFPLHQQMFPPRSTRSSFSMQIAMALIRSVKSLIATRAWRQSILSLTVVAVLCGLGTPQSPRKTLKRKHHCCKAGGTPWLLTAISCCMPAIWPMANLVLNSSILWRL